MIRKEMKVTSFQQTQVILQPQDIIDKEKLLERDSLVCFQPWNIFVIEFPCSLKISKLSITISNCSISFCVSWVLFFFLRDCQNHRMVFDGFPVLALPLQGGSWKINFESELEMDNYCREITNTVEPTSKKLYFKKNKNEWETWTNEEISSST